ncbi:three-helix bundle dimerization domain-containing protein [Mycolicibacterium fortuitum]|uniref:three-helix bundle dimerization domain-containing protein n=1 Tax=Mycolicibacterium fortuitum TaxID=1766 RepID=UPI0034CD9EEA
MSEQQQIAAVEARLGAQYPTIDPTVIAQAVHHACGCFAAAPVRDFVPLLVERRARRELATQ